MTYKFQIGQTLFNRDTGEKGTVQNIHQINGMIQYEVTIPARRGNGMSSHQSDWVEGVLEHCDGAVPYLPTRNSIA
jgi:hypothetical protein